MATRKVSPSFSYKQRVEIAIHVSVYIMHTVSVHLIDSYFSIIHFLQLISFHVLTVLMCRRRNSSYIFSPMDIRHFN